MLRDELRVSQIRKLHIVFPQHNFRLAQNEEATEEKGGCADGTRGTQRNNALLWDELRDWIQRCYDKYLCLLWDFLGKI